MERYVALFLLSLSLHTDLRVHVRIVVAPPMFYSISRQTHERHGCVVSIERTEEIGEPTPFRAVQQACKEHNMPDAFLDDVINEADQDNDGRIDYGEFVAMMTKGNMGVGRRTMRNSLNISMRDAPGAL